MVTKWYKTPNGFAISITKDEITGTTKMKIACIHCQKEFEMDDEHIRKYVFSEMGKRSSEKRKKNIDDLHYSEMAKKRWGKARRKSE